MGEGDSLDSLDPASIDQITSLVEYSDFIEFFKKTVKFYLLDDEQSNQLAVELEDKSYQEYIKKFIKDVHVSTLFVQYTTYRDEETEQGGGEDDKEAPQVIIFNEVHFTNTKMASIVFIKKSSVIEADKSIKSQVHIIPFSDGSPFETLHSLISKSISPYFKSYIREVGRAERDGDKVAISVEKKMAELEMGLLHLQQNIDIPEISLTVHPQVASVIKECADKGYKAKVADFGDLVENSTFLNQLQHGVNRWIKEIQKVTKLERDPSSGTAVQEISFWLNLEHALHRIQEKRESLEVTLTLEILKHGKRFHATVSFDTDTGLKNALDTVNDYNPLMKDFPINDLLSAIELDRITAAVKLIFSHLRKLRNTKYPIQRALRLVEAISRDLLAQLLKVLGTRRLMHIPHDEFEKVMNQCFNVFVTWEEEFEKLLCIMRDRLKKKRDESGKAAWRATPSHKRLQSRMENMRKFRHQHEQLLNVISRVLRPANQKSDEAVITPDIMDPSDTSPIEEVNMAYENVKEVDCLEMSPEGEESWEAAVARYEERIDRVESRITAHLRDQLGTAKNANEMFRIFSRFNALFVRPHIRGAIREYQTQLIQHVKDDIDRLHEQFKVGYHASHAYRQCQDKDTPPVSGSVIWIKQINRQLTTYMKHVEDVLGKGWENYIEGQKLKADGDSFRLKLNTQEIFDDWSKNVQARNLGVSGRIFFIEQSRAKTARGNVLKLKVNFHPEVITLSKEVRNFKNLGFRVPLSIVNKAHQANQLYPYAISLIESTKTYEKTLEKMESKENIASLVAGVRKELQTLIAEGVQIVWDSFKVNQYVGRFAEQVFNFQERVEYLLALEEQLEVDIRSLETCSYSANCLADILAKIQKTVDDLSLRQYSNLPYWVSRLDEEVEKKLGARLEAGIKAWTEALEGKEKEVSNTMDTETPVQTAHKLGGDPHIPTMNFEIRIQNQIMYLYPSVDDGRLQIMRQLYAWEAIVTSQTRLRSSTYQVGLDRPVSETYRNLLTKLPSGNVVIENAYAAISNKVNEVKNYLKEWLKYQSIWDMQPDFIYGRLGSNINVWMKCLNDVKKSRTTIDTSETRKQFGPLIIDYGKVQSKVTLKYDSWHKELLSKFASLLDNEMVHFHGQISKSRSELEQKSIEASSTSDAVSLITYVQSLKRNLKTWGKQVEVYRNGQNILERQRFQFPSKWLHIDNIEGEWDAFNEIIRRKNASIQSQVQSLQMKIIAEDKAVESRTNDFLTEWERTKPIEGKLHPNEALQQLKRFESKFSRLKDERDNVGKAKEALELQDPASASSNDSRMLVVFEELQDLHGVWSELSSIWNQIDELREKPWLSIHPRKLRQQLDALTTKLKELPSRLRQYDSYDHVKHLLQSYTKVNMMIVELKSDAFKERHWKHFMKKLRVSWVLSDLTLGQVWDVDLQFNELMVKEIILTAQGEMALEEFLRQVREFWQQYELDLINYQNKCRLIRGWDDLFNKVKEHINSIAAMKLSSYYKVFEEDALIWEEKLNRINALFDVWIDVQRRWVYLEGIFSGSADIKTLLPIETSRFQSISSDFLSLMKKVSKSPMVMDILNIQGVQRSLERLSDLLGKIQKALGEYLERERMSFPRFYFVGDEDLLEIIGNSKNIQRLQKHFKKMFAGISSIMLNEDNTIIEGIASREGEEVQLRSPVSTVKHPKINEWLTMLEKEMRVTLASYLADAVQDIKKFRDAEITAKDYMEWCDKYQAQIVVLAAQILWSEDVEAALTNMSNEGAISGMGPLESVLEQVSATLNVLADSVLQEQPPLRRKKLEHLINEFVHKRTVTRRLIAQGVKSPRAFEWLTEMRFYFDPRQTEVLRQLTIHMSNAKFFYGFEYLGVQDRLVQTPLTDRCYLTMTQALEARLGGSPFGPAGTGKTESVKALGNQLGRFVLVFNCDETFDFQAMGRIFVGLCQTVGAWGCFDEFNRLEERMLSAVSQQIQTIQEALKSQIDSNQESTISIELVGKQVRVSTDMAIFITMNPGYAGRSNLPDNLKKLFRSLAMTKPDRQLIAEVMLFSQGFRSAEKLACKIVPFFKLCDEQLSNQPHYDFGLRALKSVLVSAGNVKRDRIQRIIDHKKGESELNLSITDNLPEQEILIQSVCETMVPKLVAEDIPLLFSLLNDVFPQVHYTRVEMSGLKEKIKEVCKEEFLICGEGDEQGAPWMEKVLQLYQISNLNHGLMMVGPSGSGKSTAWKVLLKALERFEGVEGVSHIIDPKAISKEALYGVLDPNTREWTDGLFTHILRRIIDNVRGEISKRQWIIFDGDVDPEWVENLNSVLDDNKLLTLPNGERLSLPPNVRVMFEVQDLKYATLATVSRCGMIWFSEDVLSTEMIFENYLARLRNIALDDIDDDSSLLFSVDNSGKPTDDIISPALTLQQDVAYILSTHFAPDGLVVRALEFAMKQEHIMDFTRLRALGSLFSMLNQGVRNVLHYNHSHSNFPLSADVVERYIPRILVYSLLWSFAGDAKLKVRTDFGNFLRSVTTITLPSTSSDIIDFEVSIVNGEWVPWSNKVPQIEVETQKVAASDVVVPTLDTVRHESLLYTWLAEHKPLVLCGPPGSGKTMTLLSALRALPDMEVVSLNFSSATTPELLLKTFDHYCEYRKTPNGIILSPVQLGKWLVLFCDEINLPDMDKYATQRVISFLRQLIEQRGFYRPGDKQWVCLERIQCVGACNPPTDPGRKPLSHRFLRHVPVIYVDYPGETSLKQIYGTFSRAMLRLIPSLRGFADALTNAMVELYLASQEKFTQDMQPHYVYSPREMTRWVRGICEAIRPLESLSVDGLVRLWAHEALRLFQDRLVNDAERQWTSENIDTVALKYFSNIDHSVALARPILYSNWLSKNYVPVGTLELREYVQARLKVFYEEELDVQLVLFDEVLDHVLRIDRIFRQPQGHLLLIGVSGAGKTTLSRFVAFMNGLSVFQIRAHNKYTGADFDEDLRSVLRRSGCKNEKIAFLLDESNVLESGFLERMNTLLANGEIPGLFEGDEYTTLMTQCKEGAQREGLMLDSNEELYKWFTQQVMKNLHVVFTMNPSSEGLKDRAATSPALFNRCVLNWFGDWSDTALYQVAKEFTLKIDLDGPQTWKVPDFFPSVCSLVSTTPTHRDAVINSCVYVHQTLHKANVRLLKRGSRTMAITPRHYLDFINHFVKLYREKCSELEEQQLHLNVGLGKIAETVEQVEEMQKSLAVKSLELSSKNEAANLKLKEMVKDQQEAEKRKVQSQDIQAEIEKQTVEISQKRVFVMQDLAQVEPAVMDAQQAVKEIKKQQLVELRSMANPPSVVKLALESICLLLGENATDWKAIRAVVMRENFINSIVSSFNTELITDEVREKMHSRYLSNPDYSFEKANRASLACGPMVKWAIAQISYADMLKKVEPLRLELKSLEVQAAENKAKGEETKDLIKQLENSIASYKDEYAQLIAQATAIKTDLDNVQAKVERSMALLKSLGIERDRWENTSETFRSQMATIIGDVLLSSAYLAYAGYFDQHYRQSLFSTWSSHLIAAGIQFRPEIALTEYLSSPDERLRWQGNALPSDHLCTENAIMLSRFNRYPLIIDPSGQATEFILKEFESKKITKTSFLDDAFRKNLESALRFGNPLLVQDVENYDTILNPVLNRELRRTGGRVLITLGDQDIDISPTFVIFLSTRDPTVEFPPDICSRVTFVNFTVTRSSLQSQCLNCVLKAERPDIDTKRSDLLKLQGEFHLRLRHLEKSLLGALNESKGKLLDDDTVITTLEKLKGEATEISRKVDETDIVMKEIETVSLQYKSLSQACSSIFFTIESLNQVHFLYQYSLKFFLDIYNAVLFSNPELSTIVDHQLRLDSITKQLFSVCYDRVARGMLHTDRLTLAILLARIRLKGIPSIQNMDDEFNFFLRGKEGILNVKPPALDVLSLEQQEALLRLSTKVVAFKNAAQRIQEIPEFGAWLQQSTPEQCVPKLWEEEKTFSETAVAMYQLLFIQALRSDRVPAAAHIFVSSVFGDNFMLSAERELDLPHIVENELKGNVPALLCSVPGYDASGRVDDLAAELGKQIASIAIGSAEGFNQADNVINVAVRSGKWVLLKNVHLAPQWLVQLEKKLHSLQPHANFRLFLTMEINPKVPVNLLRAGRIFVFEPPPGIKANLLRTFSTVPATRMMKVPNERARLYFLLAWFHAIVQERLRYVPLGWSKFYEFNESDLRVACDTLDTWIDSTAMGRTNLSPDKIPWNALITLLSQSIYGGKIDNDFDQRLLGSFLSKLFTTRSFEADFALVANVDGATRHINMPDGTRRDHFLHWIEALPDRQTPSWLGLPNSAEKVLLTTRGTDLVAKLLKMQQLEDEDEFAYTEASENNTEERNVDGRPAWMRTLHNSASRWLELLPKALQTLRRTVENIKDPLYRYFEREVSSGAALLKDVVNDLEDVILICKGGKRQTNYHRILLSELVKGILPQRWCRYSVPKGCTVIQWVTDFRLRVIQLQEVSQLVSQGGAKELKVFPVWLGGLFNPEAYITATRQCIAEANGWSLEELVLDVTITDIHDPDKINTDDCSFRVVGLKLQGAQCRNNELVLTSTILMDLPVTLVRWVRLESESRQDKLSLPVYLNSTRTELLFNVELNITSGQDPHSFYQRGVALLTSTSLN